MNKSKRRPPTLFTVAYANAMLPLVRRIVEDIVDAERILQSSARVASETSRNAGHAEREGFDSRAASSAHAAMEESGRRLADCIEELAELGVQLERAEDGIVDFPAFMDDRPIMLCWKLGESTVGHWHEMEGSFPHRRPIPREKLAGSC